MQISVVISIFVVASIPQIDGCCQNITADEFQTKADYIDAVQKNLLVNRLLQKFGLAHVPHHAKLWRSRRDQRAHGQLVHESTSQAKRVEMTLHVLGVPKQQESQLDADALPCEANEPITVTFTLHHGRRGEVISAQLYFPQLSGSTAPSGAVAIKLSSYNTDQTVEREHILPVVQSPLYSLANQTVIDIGSFAVGLSTTPREKITAQLSPVDTADWCALASEIRRSPPTLRVKLVESPSRDRRQVGMPGGRANQQEMITDCDSQWDASILRSDFAGIQDGLLPCCRKRIHVNFAEIGWGDWVVAPDGFDSFYCAGRCKNFGGFATAGSQGPSFYTEVMSRHAETTGDDAARVTPCCSPVQFAPLTITVMSGPNEELTQTLEDVIVQACGCM